MLFEQMEPNERFRARRENARRRRRRRRAIAVGFLLAVTATLAAGARFVINDNGAAGAAAKESPSATKPAAQPSAPVKAPRKLPDEVRGIHVTMALASLDGKLQEYLKLVDDGLNTIELDVKDENGEIGFVTSAVPLAREVGAAKPYYRPREAARLDPRQGRLPDRPRRRLRGSAALGGPARARHQEPGRLRLAQPRRPRLDEPVRQARLGLQRLARRGRGAGRLRRDPVRLRALPHRRRRRGDRLPEQDIDAAGLGDRRVRPLRREAAEAPRRAHLDGRLRPLCDPRSRHRPDPEADLEVRRRRLPDGLPVALRRRRVRARGSERLARRRRSSGRSPTSAGS